MFFGKFISTAVIGLTALAGIATASVVPAHQLEARQVVRDPAQPALDVVTKFQSNVYSVLPKLVDYDRAGLDTTPVFKALFQYYDETEKAILSLPVVKPVDKVPTATEQKLIDVTNETLNSVNAIANILNPNKVNDVNKKTLVEKTAAVTKAIKAVIIISIGWLTIIIIVR